MGGSWRASLRTRSCVTSRGPRTPLTTTTGTRRRPGTFPEIVRARLHLPDPARQPADRIPQAGVRSAWPHPKASRCGSGQTSPCSSTTTNEGYVENLVRRFSQGKGSSGEELVRLLRDHAKQSFAAGYLEKILLKARRQRRAGSDTPRSPQRARRLEPCEVDVLVAAYRRLGSLQEAAAELGVCRQTAQRHLRARRVTITGRWG